MRFLLRILDYLFLLRPTLFFPVWTIFFAGYVSAVSVFRISDWFEIPGSGGLWWLLLGITLIAGGTFILNQLQDISNDTHNKKLFLIAEGYVRLKYARYLAVITFLIGLAIGFLSGIWTGLMFLGLIITWGYLYNYPPFRWKDRPFMGLIANMLGGFFCFAAGWSFAEPVNLQLVTRSLPYLLAFGAVALLTMIPDQDGDRTDGKETFPVRFGVAYTTWLAAGFVILAFLGGYYLRDWVITISAAVSMPLFVQTAVTETESASLKAIRYSVLFLSLMICAKLPLYFLLVLITYFLARYYYRERFDLNYPTFSTN